MSNLSIAIVWDWNKAAWAKPLVHDGLMAALNLIGEKHQVDWFIPPDFPPKNKYDWILPWGVSSIPFNDTIEKYKARKALLCAGHPYDILNNHKFETIFVESPGVYKELKGHKNVVLAFGTDTDFFKPRKMKKIIDAVYPATYSPWKRQIFFAKAIGNRGLACGVLQHDGKTEYEACLSNGVYSLVGLVPTRMVATLYNIARSCVITAVHGSERTALEAMASNLPLVVTNDNELTCSLLSKECIKADPNPRAIKEAFEEAINKEVNTRDYILRNYSHKIYAERMLKELE